MPRILPPCIGKVGLNLSLALVCYCDKFGSRVAMSSWGEFSVGNSALFTRIDQCEHVMKLHQDCIVNS